MRKKKTAKQAFEDLEEKLNKLEEWPDKVSKQEENIRNLTSLYDSELRDIADAMLEGKEHVEILNEEKGDYESKRINDFFQDISYESKKDEIAEKLALHKTRKGKEILQDRKTYKSVSYVPGLIVLFWGIVEALSWFWLINSGDPGSILSLEYLNAFIKMGIGYGLLKGLPNSLELYGRREIKKMAKKFKEYMPKNEE